MHHRGTPAIVTPDSTTDELIAVARSVTHRLHHGCYYTEPWEIDSWRRALTGLRSSVFSVLESRVGDMETADIALEADVHATDALTTYHLTAEAWETYAHAVARANHNNPAWPTLVRL